MMIDRGSIQQHEEGDPSTFVTQDKKRNGRGRKYGSRRPPPNPNDSKIKV